MDNPRAVSSGVAGSAGKQPSRRDFDDRLWPVHLALFMLAGVVAATVILGSRFDDPRPLYNGWTHLAVDAVCLAVFLWGITRLRERLVPRIQLAVALSLLAHLVLVLLLSSQYLEALLKPKKPTPADFVPEEQLVKLPDYMSLPQQDISEPDWERPVETQTPDTSRAEVTSRASEIPESPAPEPRRVDALQQPEVKPEPIEIERPERSAPRRSPRLAGLERSRQASELSGQPVEQIPQPRIRESTQPQPNTLESRITEPARQQREPELVARRTDSPARQEQARPQVAELTRRARSESLADSISASAAEIQRTRPELREPTESAELANVPAAAEATQPDDRADVTVAAVPRRNATLPPVSRALRDQLARQQQRARNVTSETSRVSPRAAARSGDAVSPVETATTNLPRSEAAALSQSTDADASIPQPVVAGEPTDTGGRAPSDGMTLEPSQGTLARTRSTLPPSRLRSSSGEGQSGSPAGQSNPSSAMADSIQPRGRADSGETSSSPTLESPRRSQVAGGRSGELSGEAAELEESIEVADTASTTGDDQFEPAPASTTRSAAAPDVTALARRPSSASGNAAQFTDQTPSRGGQPSRRATDRTPNRSAASASGAETLPRASSAGSLPAPLAKAEEPTGAIPGATTANSESGARNGAASPDPVIDAPPRRRPGLPVELAAPTGAGGFTADPAPEIGIPSRRARPESRIVRTDVERFVLERSGGSPAVNGRAAEGPTRAFEDRDPDTRRDVARSRGGTEASERAVELGLEFLARIQQDDGSWSLDRFGEGRPGFEEPGYGSMKADTAATGLALLAFLGAGYTHTEDKYRQVVRAGLDYLVENQKPDGDLFAAGSRVVWFYSHGIASIVLGEAYGMTRDPALREPAQRALGFTIESQNPELGGWRYRPRWESDTSVSGWQVMALRSGELARLDIPREPYALITRWLDTAQADGDPSRYVYLPGFVERNGGEASRAMTAEGLLMRLLLDWDRTNPHVQRGAQYLIENLPGTNAAGEPLRDAYYWYYGTQVMFEMQGDFWPTWNNRLRDMLVESQQADGPLAGSWDPSLPVPDRWGDAGGRLYVTAMHLLILEVYYRHLPLYQTLGD